jgi:hypothetical protein
MLTRLLHDYGFFYASYIPTPSEHCVNDFSQDKLIDKINVYLTQQGRRLMSHGYCHGLTLLWLKRMAAGREQEFYTTIKNMIACPNEQLADMAHVIEKMRRSIDKKQQPRRYYRYARYQIDQFNIDAILKSERQLSLDGEYTQSSLETMLNTFCWNDDMFCISSCYDQKDSEDNHTIGIYKRNQVFYLYDANNQSGVAGFYYSTEVVANEIFRLLYNNFNLERPDKCVLEIKKTRYNDTQLQHLRATKPPGTLSIWSNPLRYVNNLAAYFSTAAKTQKAKPEAKRKRFASDWQCDGLMKRIRR